MSIKHVHNRLIESYNENPRRKSNDAAASLFGKKVYRPLSFIPTILLIKLGFSANAISTASAFVLFISASFFLQPNAELQYIGALIYFLFIILDFVDGNVARYHKKATVYGKLLDGFVDSMNPIIFTAVGFASENAHPENPYLSISLGLAVSFCFILNILFRLRLTHLVHISTLEGLISGDPKAPSATAEMSKSSLPNLVKMFRKEAIMITPILLIVASVYNLLFEFLLFYAFIHCAIGVAEILFYLLKYRSILLVPTSWARDLWNQSPTEFKKK